MKRFTVALGTALKHPAFPRLVGSLPLSPVVCHLSSVTCRLSPVVCHLSPATCHLHQVRRLQDKENMGNLAAACPGLAGDPVAQVGGQCPRDIRTSGHPDIGTSGHPDIRTSDIRTSDIGTSGHRDIGTSGHPDITH